MTKDIAGQIVEISPVRTFDYIPHWSDDVITREIVNVKIQTIENKYGLEIPRLTKIVMFGQNALDISKQFKTLSQEALKASKMPTPVKFVCFEKCKRSHNKSGEQYESYSSESFLELAKENYEAFKQAVAA